MPTRVELPGSEAPAAVPEGTRPVDEYVAPERLAYPGFRALLSRLACPLVAIDPPS